jgi:hypothetical protein
MSAIELRGLRGDNPLAFMAAVGALVVLARSSPPDARPAVRLSWRSRAGIWRPRLHLEEDLGEEALVARLFERVHRPVKPEAAASFDRIDRELRKVRKQYKAALSEHKQRLKRREFARNSDEERAAWRKGVAPAEASLREVEARWEKAAVAGGQPDATTALGPVVGVHAERFRRFVEEAFERADVRDRRTADFATAFGCECINRDDSIQPTRLSKQNGNSGKNMLRDTAALMQGIRPERLRASLFAEWDYGDEGLGLGWDPRDVRPFAFQAVDPGTTPSVTMHGANLLAYEALPLLPTAPTSRDLATTGTAKVEREEFWSWPIWEAAVGVDVIRTLLALPELHRATPRYERLTPLGIRAVFRSQHYKEGKSQRLRPAKAV